MKEVKRIVKNTKYDSNEKILEEFKNKVVHPQIEEIVLNASYNLYEEPVVEPDPENSEN